MDAEKKSELEVMFEAEDSGLEALDLGGIDLLEEDIVPCSCCGNNCCC